MSTILFKIVIFVIVELTLIQVFVTSVVDVNLINNFFSVKFLKYGYVFDCFLIHKRINFTKSLMKEQLRISENNIKQHYFYFQNISFSHHFGVVVDGDCENINNPFMQVKEFKLFDERHHWLIVTSNHNFSERLQNFAMNINVNLYIAILNKPENIQIRNWTIFDVYNPAYKHGGELKIKSVGFYNQNRGFQVKTMENKYWVRKNMTGVNFKTMVVIRKPFHGPLDKYLESDENRTVDSFNRFQYHATHYCKELYNFSWEVNMTTSWGYAVAENKFDGLIGALQAKEIDFGSAAVFVKYDRIPVVDFARSLWKFRSVFIFRQPTAKSFSQVFLHPLSPSVWFSTLAVVVLIVIILKIIQAAEFKILKGAKTSIDQTWSTVVLSVLGTFCQQGFSETSILLSARVIMLHVLLFCLLFYQFYSGSIVSNLLIEPPAQIRSLQDLLDSDLKVGSDDVPYIKEYFHVTTDPVIQKLYQKKFLKERNLSSYYPVEYGLDLVERGGFAYQVEISAAYPTIVYTFSDEAICELGEVKMLPFTLILTPLQKHSPFRDMLNYCFHRQIEHGINERQRKYWGPSKPQCLQTSHSMSFHVGVREIYPALVLLALGMLMSCIILGLEVFLHMRNQNRKESSVPNVLLTFTN